MRKILIMVFSIFLLTSCSILNKTTKITYKEDTKNQITKNYTYKFTGQSNYFYFETGKVYYNDKEREIIISNFKIQNDLDKKYKISLYVYFNDVSFYAFENLTHKEFKKTIIKEQGTISEKDENNNIIGDTDPFLETTKDTFKDSIKIEIKYCLKNKCETEKLNLTYEE